MIIPAFAQLTNPTVIFSMQWRGRGIEVVQNFWGPKANSTHSRRVLLDSAWKLDNMEGFHAAAAITERGRAGRSKGFRQNMPNQPPGLNAMPQWGKS